MEPEPNGSDARTSRQVEARTELLIAVRDTGRRVDPKSVDRLFQAFYTTKAESMGVALSMSRSIVEAHGGRLWASVTRPAVLHFNSRFLPQSGTL